VAYSQKCELGALPNTLFPFPFFFRFFLISRLFFFSISSSLFFFPISSPYFFSLFFFFSRCLLSFFPFPYFLISTSLFSSYFFLFANIFPPSFSFSSFLFSSLFVPVSLPSGTWAELQPQLNLVHYGLKI